MQREKAYLFQIGIGLGFMLLFWIFARPKEPESGFRVRESDSPSRGKPNEAEPQPSLADARMKTAAKSEAAPLRLTGIRLDLPPHELLGVHPDATQETIQKAYRELMKRYHPDKIGRPGSQEWTDAQKIAEAFNRARAEMLKTARKR